MWPLLTTEVGKGLVLLLPSTLFLPGLQTKEGVGKFFCRGGKVNIERVCGREEQGGGREEKRKTLSFYFPNSAISFFCTQIFQQQMKLNNIFKYLQIEKVFFCSIHYIALYQLFPPLSPPVSNFSFSSAAHRPGVSISLQLLLLPKNLFLCSEPPFPPNTQPSDQTNPQSQSFPFLASLPAVAFGATP